MAPRATPARERVATAFAPGHVTGVFSPDLSARDPRGRGSVGAGIVLEMGVRASARWRPLPRGTHLRVTSNTSGPLPISRDVARRLVGDRPGRLDVHLEHGLPIGQGFGMSAAGALSTGLAVARLLGLPARRAIETAHLADLFGGGGLGGVAAILGGGLEIRYKAGLPPFGRIRHVPFRFPILLTVVGRALPSPALLHNALFLERVRVAAAEALPRLRARPTPSVFLAESERFTDALGLASPPIRRRLAEARATGARAAQTMFGESLFIVPRSGRERRAALRLLERAKLPGLELRAAPRGARLTP